MIESYDSFGAACARLDSVSAKPSGPVEAPHWRATIDGEDKMILVDSRITGVRLYIFPATCDRLPECFRAGWYGCTCTTRRTEMNLPDALEHASALAYADNGDQIVGLVDGTWQCAHWEDVGRISEMEGNGKTFLVHSDGPDMCHQDELDENWNLIEKEESQ